jgi:hypothetical protein
MSIRDKLISGPLGAGLSEMRLGRAPPKHKRGEYALSSKVGRLILVEVESGPKPLGNVFRNIPEAEATATVDAAWQQGIRPPLVLETSSGAPSLCSTSMEVHRNPAARWLRPKDEQAEK